MPEALCWCLLAGVVAAGVVGIVAAAAFLFLYARTRRRKAEHLLALHSSGLSPAKSGTCQCMPQYRSSLAMPAEKTSLPSLITMQMPARTNLAAHLELL